MHRIEETEKALNLLDTYDGQLSKTARALWINRYTLRSWRDKRKVCTPLEVLSLYQTCRSNTNVVTYSNTKCTLSRPFFTKFVIPLKGVHNLIKILMET